MEPLPGENPGGIGGYRLQRLLGFGAIGPVYLAVAPEGPAASGSVDAAAFTRVTLTVVRPELAADDGFAERLRTDTESARRVEGPRAVPLAGADPDGSPPWLASAYVSGPSLAQALAEHGPMPTQGVHVLLEGAAAALEAIHAAGLPHLALDPTSVLLTADGPRVTGFGLVRALEAAALSRRGVVARSPLFMAPEQILDRDASARADVFALGHLAAYALLGRSPFGGGDALALAHRILNETPDLRPLPEPLRGIVERCLARDPDARPAPAEVVEFCQANRPEHSAPAVAWPPPAPTLAPEPEPESTLTLASVPEPPAAPQPAAPQTASGPEPTQPLPAPPVPPALRLKPPAARNPRQAAEILGVALLAAGLVIAVVLGGVLLAAKTPASTTAAGQHPATLQTGARLVTASPSPSTAIDPCLVGSWAGVSDDLANKIDNNPVTFTGTGPSVVFQADGMSTVDYGQGTAYSATVNGHNWQVVYKGSATMQTATRGGVLYVSNVSANGSWVFSEDGSTTNTGALSINLTPGPYICSATTLVEYTSDGSDTMTLTRKK